MGSDRSWEDLLDMTSNKPEPTDRRRLFLGVGWTLLIFLLCLFLPAGNWAWARGWLFFVVVVGTSILITLYLRRVNPDVIAARVNRHGGTKGWDRLFLGILIPTMVIDPPGGSPGRQSFSLVPRTLVGLRAGICLLVAGLAGMTWAESVNKFFEPTVRIQTDRGHKVIDTGPYALVRHPGYVAACLLFMGMPLALGSLWALIPAILRACSWSCERSGRTGPSRVFAPCYRAISRASRFFVATPASYAGFRVGKLQPSSRTAELSIAVSSGFRSPLHCTS